MANAAAEAISGGSSVSGISVSCYSSMENCLEACYMSCYIAEHCNDSAEAMVACAPSLFMMISLTIAFVLTLCCIFCVVCIGPAACAGIWATCCLSTCCCCILWYRKGQNYRNRADGERKDPEKSSAYPNAPPLLPKT